jgi:lipoate-protein ligase B
MSYEVQNWGLIDYQKALEQQEKAAAEVADKNLNGFIILCSHPPVVTLGRATQAGDVFAWTGNQIEISRGGRATYHGPSQLVVYPIINLNFETTDRPARDIGAYLRNLEAGIVKTLKSYGVSAEGRSPKKKTEQDAATDETGVWVENRKIASLGIAVKRWVSLHGMAINLDQDPSAFQGLKPCGFTASTMVSLQELTGNKIDRPAFEKNLLSNLQELI